MCKSKILITLAVIMCLFYGLTSVEIFAEDNPPVHEQIIRIMPLGDSITAGEHSGFPTYGERTYTM